MESTILVFNPETKRTELGETKQTDDIQSLQNEIIAFLRSEKEPVVQQIIDKNIGGRTTLKRKALYNLVAEKLIERTGAGKKGDVYRYSCSLVPNICTEQEKQETKNEMGISEEKTDQQILDELGL